jgi:endonuclease-3
MTAMPPAAKPAADARAKTSRAAAAAETQLSAKPSSETRPAKAKPPKAKASKAQPFRISVKTPPTRRLKRRSEAEIQALFERFRAANPEPKGELEAVNAYTLLVAVVLSAQATDAGVNKATRPLFAIADTPQKMVALGEERVRDFIKSIGLFRTKAKNVIALSQKLIDAHGGEVPADREALQALPGVGRKTANVVLNIAFGQIAHAVDTHVFRIANRLRIAPGKNPLAVEKALEKAVPEAFGVHAHHWLILHGRYTCKAMRPACERCVVADLCDAAEKRLPVA